jgi:hypothetical protein
MNLILDTPTARIWSDANAPYVFSIFHTWPASENEFATIAETYSELLKKVKKTFGEVYSICDLSTIVINPGKEMIHLFESCVEKQLKLGIKRKAFVLSKDFAKGLFSKPELVKSDRLSFHLTFQQALVEINQLRLKDINQNMAIL